jgi:lipopolysaccharide transport system ATP-binding protein
MSIAIKAENLSKLYRLGEIGTGTISHDLHRWFTRLRGKEDPFLKIGETNDRETKGGDVVYSLCDLNFEIQQGDAVGIIGRNGAGKSTLLKILSRVTSPTTGRINIKGRVASLLEVGTGFHPELTGKENIYLNGAILGMRKKEIDRKLEAIVDFSGVERYIDTPVKRYSSGMYVRLAFAVAAHLESEILIVDEVLAVGDADFQKKCLGKMGEVSKGEGRTILFVSHNMTAIANLCNKTIILKNGKIEHDGSLNTGINLYLKESSSLINNNSLKDFLLNQNDEIFQLSALEVFQEGVPGSSFLSDRDINIHIKYEILKEIVGLRVGFDLFDKLTGSVIFRSFHDDSFTDISTVKAGSYSTIFKINSNLLREGDYYLSLAVGIHNKRWIIYDSLKFEFNITNINGVNKIYADNRPGIIMPKLDIRTVAI